MSFKMNIRVPPKNLKMSSYLNLQYVFSSNKRHSFVQFSLAILFIKRFYLKNDNRNDLFTILLILILKILDITAKTKIRY